LQIDRAWAGQNKAALPTKPTNPNPFMSQNVGLTGGLACGLPNHAGVQYAADIVNRLT